jgi:hypothetical protein
MISELNPDPSVFVSRRDAETLRRKRVLNFVIK